MACHSGIIVLMNFMISSARCAWDLQCFSGLSNVFYGCEECGLVIYKFFIVASSVFVRFIFHLMLFVYAPKSLAEHRP